MGAAFDKGFVPPLLGRSLHVVHELLKLSQCNHLLLFVKSAVLVEKALVPLEVFRSRFWHSRVRFRLRLYGGWRRRPDPRTRPHIPPRNQRDYNLSPFLQVAEDPDSTRTSLCIPVTRARREPTSASTTCANSVFQNVHVFSLIARRRCARNDARFHASHLLFSPPLSCCGPIRASKPFLHTLFYALSI